ncbi:SMP-30/gluconolactonase/LRE family protein, partial [Streptomyces aureus]|uniref:SMP-30/gluconolactonase/LRE family protein n=1 Tax=Streptomyces aureus TaxID=193461 RepID=UPI000AA0EC5C
MASLCRTTGTTPRRPDAAPEGPALDGDGLATLLNGLGWSPDGTLLSYADSPTGRVDVFAYDVATGTLSDRRPFAVLDRGVPDGLTVDAAGRVSVAVWGGGDVLAFTPEGTLHARVEG